MNPSFGSRERRSRTTLSRGSRKAQFQGFRQGQRRRSLFLHSSALFFFSFDSVRPERSANASSVTRSARADSGFASTRVASKTSGRVALPRRDNFMAPEGAARGPVRYVPCSEIPTRVSFLSSVFFRRHLSPRSNHEGGHVPEEDARRGVRARLARVLSRARTLPGPNRSSRDPHDPNHRHPAARVAFRPPLFVCTTKCGRHTDVCRTSH